ncbi:MAG TPA: hypothetical protein VGD98_11475 [Ktedonobacteraceae bacterium]
MFRSAKNDFTPDQVDEQIASYLIEQRNISEEQTDQRAIQLLQSLYSIRRHEYTASLERVWQRVRASEEQENVLPVITEKPLATVDEREETGQSGVLVSFSPRGQRGKRIPRLALLAAVLALVVIGGFALANNFQSHNPLTVQRPFPASGLYAYLNNALYDWIIGLTRFYGNILLQAKRLYLSIHFLH